MRIKAVPLMIWFVIFLMASAWAQQPPLYVVDLSSADLQDKLLTISIQGLANRDPQGASVFIFDGGQEEHWLAWNLRLQPRPVEHVTPTQLLEKFRPLIRGQVLYDAGNPLSLNIATSIAALRSGVLTDHNLELPVLADLRSRFKKPVDAYTLAAKEVVPRSDQQAVALLGDGVRFRDYLIKEKIAVLPLPDRKDTESWRALGKLLTQYPAGTTIFTPTVENLSSGMSGWAHRLGCNITAAEDAANLSFHSQYRPPVPLRQWPKYTPLAGKIYLCFLFSGGNNLAHPQGRMNELWRDPQRGRLPLGWSIPAQSSAVMPDVMQAYYGDAYRNGNDSFLFELKQIAQTQSGTFFPLLKAQTQLDASAYIVLDSAEESALLPSLNRLIAETRPQGIFLPDRKSISSQIMGGTVVMTNGFSASDAQQIVQRLSALPTAQGGMIFVYVDSSKLSPSDITGAVDRLPPFFEVVAPEEFLYLTRKVLSKERQEVPTDTRVMLTVPATAKTNEPLAARATVENGKTEDAILVFRQENGLAYMEPMVNQGSGQYTASLGPLMHGGKWQFEARISEGEGKVAISQLAIVDVEPEDNDADGLSVSEEALYATGIDNPDTDEDGLLDGVDGYPHSQDSSRYIYFGPLLAVEDAPYLAEDHGSSLASVARRVSGDSYFVYRMRAEGLPAGAGAALVMRMTGKAKVSFSTDGRTFGTETEPQPLDAWYSVPIPQELLTSKGLFVKISSATEPPNEAAIQELAICSLPDTPSIAAAALTPPYPGPGVPIAVSVNAWDPKGISGVWCAYREGRGVISVPLTQIEKTPTWIGSLGRLENARGLDWWIVAENKDGRRAASRITYTWVGTMPAETSSFFAGKELRGEWQAASSGWNYAREAVAEGLKDTAQADMSGGNYEVWLLAGGRGREVGVWIDDNHFASIDPRRPDGWQHLGRIKLPAGTHTFDIVSGLGPKGTAAKYGQLFVTAVSSMRLPPYGVLETSNSISLSLPRRGDTIGSRTQVMGSAAGNISRVEFFADGKLVRRFNSPPFIFNWDSGRLPAGPHILRMAGYGRSGQTLAILEIEVVKGTIKENTE